MKNGNSFLLNWVYPRVVVVAKISTLKTLYNTDQAEFVSE